VTALAPAVLLSAAVLLAAGAGFGGLSSLGQVAAGPPLPAVQGVTTSDRTGRDALADSPVVALATPTAAATRPSGDTGPTARGEGGASGGQGSPQARTNAPVGNPRTPGTTSPGGTGSPTTQRPGGSSPTPPSTGTAPSTPGGTGTPTAPVGPQLPSTPKLPSVPAPVQQLLDLPRNLPAPIGPLTDRTLDSVTGILPR
jgi:hypothetical protein